MGSSFQLGPIPEPRREITQPATKNLKGKHSKLKSSNLFVWGENN